LNLKLHITKREITHHSTIIKTKYLFSVIDLDRSDQYPQNFVSVLPRKINVTVKPCNIFEELFGNRSLETAKQLLEKALERRPNSETTKAIRHRLKLLNPQLNNKSKCQNCGKPIKQNKQKFRPYKFCYQCHSKGYK